MDTLFNDLLGVISNYFEVIDSILLGNIEDFRLDNKKWINYAIYSGHPIFSSILKNLDLQTLEFIYTTTPSTRRATQIDSNKIYIQIFKKLFPRGYYNANRIKEILLAAKMRPVDEMHLYIWKILIYLIKINREFNYKLLELIEAVDEMCRKIHVVRLEYRDMDYIDNSLIYGSDLITYVYRYGDKRLIDYYEKTVFSAPDNQFDPESDIEFVFKLIGLVQSGRDAGYLIHRLTPNTRQNKEHRVAAIICLLKTGHNQVVKQLLSQFYGSTIQEQLISANKFADRIYKSDSSLYRFFEPAARGNNLEMCSVIVNIGLESNDISSMVKILNCAFMYDLKLICMKILEARPLLRTTIAIYKCCNLKARTSIELLKYIEEQLDGFDRSKIQTLIIRSIQNGRLTIAEYCLKLLMRLDKY